MTIRRLVGPRGVMQYRLNEETGRAACISCPWFIDASYVSSEETDRYVVEHDCPAQWKGFARYTIRPERPTGRRTA